MTCRKGEARQAAARHDTARENIVLAQVLGVLVICSTVYRSTGLPVVPSYYTISYNREQLPIPISKATMAFARNGPIDVDLSDDECESRIPNGQTSRAFAKKNDTMVVQCESKSNGSMSSYPPKRTQNQRWVPVVVGMAMLLCFVCGLYLFLKSKQKMKSVSENVTPITFEEFLLHNDKINDCWILINDAVYDVTQYAPTHPGGAEYVTDFCGRNSTRDYYIHHPYEYIKFYLSSDARVGVISTNISTTTVATGVNEMNGTDAVDENAVGAPTLVPTEFPEPSSIPTEMDEPSSAPSVINESSLVPTMVNETSSAPNATVSAPASRSIAPVSKPSAPTSIPIAPTTKPITPTTRPIAPTPVPIIPPVPSCISSNEVALHNSETDCYYILYDFVYDFTNYINEHPGGARKVFQECGTDATSVYSAEKKHDEGLLLEVNALELYGLGYAC